MKEKTATNIVEITVGPFIQIGLMLVKPVISWYKSNFDGV